jgi:hypothetical protein
MTDRDRVLRTIRALLQKTVANGCPVEEALSAHAKAQALIDKYQVSHEELYGTGPGRSRKPEPEPAEPKQQQQPAPERPTGTGELSPFKSAIAVGIVLTVAVLWAVSVGTDVSGPFKSSQVVEAPKDNVAPPAAAPVQRPPRQQQQKPLDHIFPPARPATPPSAVSQTTKAAPQQPVPQTADAEVSFFTKDLGAVLPKAKIAATVALEDILMRVKEEAAYGRYSLANVAAKPIAPVAERVVLYDEDPSDPRGKQYVGTVIWRTEPIKARGNQKIEIALRADIDIPDRKFKMTMSFRRNTDSSLPASHTAELTFILPPDFPGGGVANLPGILMKSNEQARGTPLAGLAVKVTDGFFLVGLSNVDADRARNVQLLKERSWFDVPLVYANQRRAIIAIEKGAPGERAFNDAFAAWGEDYPTASTASQPPASASRMSALAAAAAAMPQPGNADFLEQTAAVNHCQPASGAKKYFWSCMNEQGFEFCGRCEKFYDSGGICQNGDGEGHPACWIAKYNVAPFLPAQGQQSPPQQQQIPPAMRNESPPQPPGFGTGNGILGVLPASNVSLAAPPSPAAASPVDRTNIVAASAPIPRAQPNSPGSGPVAAVTHIGWIVQIGAFESEGEARQRIEAARSSARGLLDKADPFTELIARDNRKLYRVRFTRLDQDQAEAVCRTLKRANIPCITVRN